MWPCRDSIAGRPIFSVIIGVISPMLGSFSQAGPYGRGCGGQACEAVGLGYLSIVLRKNYLTLNDALHY